MRLSQHFGQHTGIVCQLGPDSVLDNIEQGLVVYFYLALAS
jgi:hypothetical protein